MLKLLLSLLIVSLITACSSKELYEFGQNIALNNAECEELVSPEERLACEKRYAKEYEEYQQELREASKEKK